MIDFSKFDAAPAPQGIRKCIQTKYRAYLLDDALLEEALETGTYNGENVLQVYLDGFVCEKKEHNQVVKDVGGPYYTVPGKSDFPAHAVRFGVRFPGMTPNWPAQFLNGQYHLAWFINDRLVWVVKNLAWYDSKSEQAGGPDDVFYLVNPRFLASAIIDRRDTCLGGEQGKRVAGWALPAGRWVGAASVAGGRKGEQMKQPQCYKVSLKTTNALHTSAMCRGEYIDVEDGTVYVLAEDARAAAAMCPEVLSIVRVGIGYEVDDDAR